MAKRTFDFLNQTFTAQNFSAALTNATFAGIQGGSSTQLIDILEVMLSGMAVSSIVAGLVLCRVSTVASTGLTALAAPNSDGPNHPSTAVLSSAPGTYVAATVSTAGPFASNSTGDAKISLGQNAFGGIVRWNAAPTQQFSILGNTANLGSAVVFNSSQAGGSSAAVNGHIIYEPY